jgi:hypothetical protein
MSLLGQVQARLDELGLEGWERELIEVMARSLEDSPNASMAQTLSKAMDAAGASAAPASLSPLDELRAKREERLSGRSKGSKRPVA